VPPAVLPEVPPEVPVVPLVVPDAEVPPDPDVPPLLASAMAARDRDSAAAATVVNKVTRM
jgi:hypothetical protein